jgi:hypothetical protein
MIIIQKLWIPFVTNQCNGNPKKTSWLMVNISQKSHDDSVFSLWCRILQPSTGSQFVTTINCTL